MRKRFSLVSVVKRVVIHFITFVLFYKHSHVLSCFNFLAWDKFGWCSETMGEGVNGGYVERLWFGTGCF